jgi:hydrogenase maturation protein HypF
VIEKLITKPGVRTSSCGRLFDAVSSICGISQDNSYEGESAMLLEAAADAHREGSYEIPIELGMSPWILDTRPMIAAIAWEITTGARPGAVSRRFHDSLAQAIQAVCAKLRAATGIEKVCLSGGTFQNVTLLRGTVALLRSEGFEVYIHSQVPANDGGISLGQAAIAAASLAIG